MTHIGLFFGSFNPVHVGHMIIANYMIEYTAMDELWMILSPQNPFKSQKSLANDYDRLHLLKLAIGDHLKIRASDVEFGLPRPSYTIDTLSYLKEKYPKKRFSLIMGGDNIASFHKWKNYKQILAQHDIYVYKRGTDNEHKLGETDRVKYAEAPLLQVSASYIRNAIKQGKSIQYLVTEQVFNYLNSNNIYKKL
jgi:nicotinate-nucleotide adenylyltransferase